MTFKQEQFAKLVAQGMGYGEAYRTAYDVRPGTKDNTVYVQGSKLMGDPKIAQRVADLAAQYEREKPLDPAQTRQTLVKHLMDMLADEKLKASDRLKALELMGKVRGVGLFAEIQEVEHSNTTVEERAARLRAMLDSLTPKAHKGSADLPAKSDADRGEPEGS